MCSPFTISFFKTITNESRLVGFTMKSFAPSFTTVSILPLCDDIFIFIVLYASKMNSSRDTVVFINEDFYEGVFGCRR